MPNECARKCWHCGHKGRNSRPCSKGCTGFKLFGVQIDVASDDGGESSIRKSKSLGNLEACNPENTASAAEASGYLSDGLVHQSSKSHERKKGKPWSEDEHRSFLVGLEKLGKGSWKEIANTFVPSRNSSQVASHAQKYFIRMATTEKKRRRASVFDIPLSDVNQQSQVIPGSQSDKATESSQPASSWAASSKNIGELKGLASMPVPGAASERPPLSPMKRRGIPDFRSMVYTPRVTSFTQGFPTQTVMPTVSWVPVVNFSSQSSFFLPNVHGTLATCSTFLPQPSVATLRQSLQQGSSQAGAAAPTTHNDELNLNIRKLTL